MWSSNGGEHRTAVRHPAVPFGARASPDRHTSRNRQWLDDARQVLPADQLNQVGRTLPRVQDIGIGAARVTAVTQSEKTPTVYLEFRGVRAAPHVTDKDTRVRIALSVAPRC